MKKAIIRLKGKIVTGTIWLNGEELTPEESLKVISHSPTGFGWGYGGWAPAQLALAICLKLFDRETALKIYQEVKWKYIANIPSYNFDREIVIEANEKINKIYTWFKFDGTGSEIITGPTQEEAMRTSGLFDTRKMGAADFIMEGDQGNDYVWDVQTSTWSKKTCTLK